MVETASICVSLVDGDAVTMKVDCYESYIVQDHIMWRDEVEDS